MGALRLTLVLDVTACSCCGGSHAKVRFTPVRNPQGGKTHQGVCPATGTPFFLDTAAQPGAWEGLLGAAGVKDG